MAIVSRLWFIHGWECPLIWACLSDFDMEYEYKNGNLELSAVHLLHRAGQCAGDIFHSDTTLEDLTPRQFAILVTVAHNEGLSQTDLVQKTGIDRSTLADIVRRMLTKGLLIRRRTRQDARAYSVKLTDAGWDMLRAAEPAACMVDKRILSVLPPAQRDEFLTSLNIIVQSMNENESGIV